MCMKGANIRGNIEKIDISGPTMIRTTAKMLCSRGTRLRSFKGLTWVGNSSLFWVRLETESDFWEKSLGLVKLSLVADCLGSRPKAQLNNTDWKASVQLSAHVSNQA